MGKISVLDEALINKIAAGEVIERPASVVKECVENSLDAGATHIKVELENGGINHIKITDNGSGMDVDDAALCFERHATSKITTTDDLFAIDTLGFRGEALASIAAIAHVKLTTCKEGATEGTCVSIVGGKIISQSPIGCPQGTILEIDELFFNTPARKKYLKSTTTELAHVVDILTRYALLHPEVHFAVSHNGRDILQAPSTDMKNNLVNLHGVDTATQMLPVDYASSGVTVSGYIAKPTCTRSDRNSMSLFVNGRFVKNKVITDAIMEAYRTLLHEGRYPVVVLSIRIDPTTIDVNVHPTKIHIRLQSESHIAELVTEALSKTLLSEKLIPSAAEETIMGQPVFPKDRQTTVGGGFVKREFTPSVPTPASAIAAGYRKYPLQQGSQQMLKEPERMVARVSDVAPTVPQFNVLGQIHKTYVVAEVEEGLYLIDQHIAEERVWYERFMKQARGAGVVVQELVSPVQLQLSPKDAIVLSDNLEVFTKLGFEIEEFGKNAFVIRKIPVLLGRNLGKQAVMDILDDVIRNLGDSPKLTSLENKMDATVAMMSCKASIRAGDAVTPAYVNKMVADLLEMDNPYTCPHGRPVIVKLTLRELDKMFGRLE